MMYPRRERLRHEQRALSEVVELTDSCTLSLLLSQLLLLLLVVVCVCRQARFKVQISSSPPTKKYNS